MSDIKMQGNKPLLETHPINSDEFTTIKNSIQNKYLYEIFDVGDSEVGFKVGDLVDVRLVRLVNDYLKSNGACLVMVHSHDCGRYDRTKSYCFKPDSFWNIPDCNSRHEEVK